MNPNSTYIASPVICVRPSNANSQWKNARPTRLISK